MLISSSLVPVEDVQQEEMSSVLTWRLSKYHKTLHGFEIYYSSSDVDCSDSGRRKVQVNWNLGKAFKSLNCEITVLNCSKVALKMVT